jgi:hypothetical protein
VRQRSSFDRRLGLAYPGLTSVYKGSNPDNDSQNNSEPYNPFFFSAVNQSRVAPFFSVALYVPRSHSPR